MLPFILNATFNINNLELQVYHRFNRQVINTKNMNKQRYCMIAKYDVQQTTARDCYRSP